MSNNIITLQKDSNGNWHVSPDGDGGGCIAIAIVIGTCYFMYKMAILVAGLLLLSWIFAKLSKGDTVSIFKKCTNFILIGAFIFLIYVFLGTVYDDWEKGDYLVVFLISPFILGILGFPFVALMIVVDVIISWVDRK